MRLLAKLLRRKVLSHEPSVLQRSLGLLTLTALGVGATLGSGVYVLWGVVAKNTTGPAVVLSFIVAGFASVLSGLCYAEFGSRVPRAGSAYVYAYVTVGELLAWTTGWQLLLEYIIGASAVAVSLSGYLDSLAGGRISTAIASSPGGSWHVPGLTPTPDFLAAGLTLIFTCVVAAGVKESTRLNNVLTGINLAVIAFVITAGLFHVKGENFVPFAPFGSSSILSGAATLFFCFVGFDVIATSAEEALNPSRNIPGSILLSLAICTAAYVSVAGIVTLMVPYSSLDTGAPLAKAFGAVGLGWASSIIEIGAVAGLTTSLMTCVFPMPRILYAISTDGLLPDWLGRVHPRTGTPVTATLLAGGLAAFLALVFDINTLAEMMSIGTLVAYTLVAASVLVLRFRDYEEREDAAGTSAVAAALAAGVLPVGAGGGGGGEEGDEGEDAPLTSKGGSASGTTRRSSLEEHLCASSATTEGDGGRGFRLCGMRPYAAASSCLAVFTLAIAGASAVSVLLTSGTLNTPAVGALATLAAAFLLLALAAAHTLARVPSCVPRNVDFVVPWCPWLPLAAVAVNVYLCAYLSPTTWLRFIAWCALGSAIYFGWGIHHSRAGVGAQGSGRSTADTLGPPQ